MPKKLSVENVRRHRAGRLGLLNGKNDIVGLAHSNCGLHATSFLTPYLSLMARDLPDPFSTLNKTQLVERKLVRLRAMRQTLFILPAELAPVILAGFRSKPRLLNNLHANWKVDPEKIIRQKKRVLDALSKGPKPIRDLKVMLPDISEHKLIGKRSERSTLLAFLLQLLQLEGRVISEKVVAQNTVKNASQFVKLTTAYPGLTKPPSDEECLKKVIHWYFDNQGPGDLDDLSWWSGISKIVLKKIIDSVDLMEVEVGDNGKGMLITQRLYERIASYKGKQNDTVRLLPYEDPYLKGHKDRSVFLSGVPEATVYQGGETRPTICVDGRIVGLWRFIEHGEDLRIGVELFDKSAVDTERLNLAKEKIITFTSTHFHKSLDKFAKGIFTGTEPYA